MIIRDNFLPDPMEARRQAIASEFKTLTYDKDGAEYTGISLMPTPGWFDLVAQVAGKKIKPMLSCFRLNLEGELPHSWVHSDEICARYASVLYLNTPGQCKGGTAFWKHKTRNLEHMDLTIVPQLHKEWKELEHWEQTMLVPMEFNRFITYPTSLFHSRYPFAGFGKTPADGRLIWICFYDVEES